MSLPFPFGTTLTVSAAQSVPPDRREYIDENNQLQSARMIDAVSRDYVLSGNGHFVGQDVVQQQVYMSLLTEFNSSAQAGLGNQFFNIKLITPTIVNECTAAVKSALANLLNSQTILLERVDVVMNVPGQVILHVVWSEVATKRQRITNLPMQKSL